MSFVLEVLFAPFLGVCCLLLGICVEVGLDYGFEYAGRHRAAEGLVPDAEPIGAADDAASGAGGSRGPASELIFRI